MLHPGIDCIDENNRFLIHSPKQDVTKCAPGCVRIPKKNILDKKRVTDVVSVRNKKVQPADTTVRMPGTYQELWDMYFSSYGTIRTYAIAFLRADAEEWLDEIIHSVFLTCMKQDVIHRFTGGDFLLFIIGITKNIILKHYGKQENHLSIDTHDDMSTISTAYIQNTLEHNHDPERSYANRELIHILLSTVQNMASIGQSKLEKQRWIKFPAVFYSLLYACDADKEINAKASRADGKYRKVALRDQKSRSGMNKEVAEELDIEEYQASRYITELRAVASRLCEYPRPKSLY